LETSSIELQLFAVKLFGRLMRDRQHRLEGVDMLHITACPSQLSSPLKAVVRAEALYQLE
jgi:hypothetical protein